MFDRKYIQLMKSWHYPIKNYRGLSPNYRGERWAYVHLIREAANLLITYLWPAFCLHHEACKCVYLRILISEASKNKNMKGKCTQKQLRLFSWDYFNRENSHYVRHISILSPCKSDVRRIGLISSCKSDNCRCVKSLVIFTRSIWGTYRDNCSP